MKHSIADLDYALVRKTALFARLDEDTLDAFLEKASVRTVSHGEMLFVQGDPVRAFFLVLEGWIKIYRLTPSGEEAVVAIFTRGQTFAEAAAFTGQEFPVSGEAVSDGRLLSIPSNVLLNQIRANPEVGLSMLASTSMHLYSLVQQIEQLKAHTGAQRVAEFLVSLCPGDCGNCTIALPYDKALIAGRLGMKPESLSRAFARLRDLGVSVEQSSVSIEDVNRLHNYAISERTAMV